MPYQKTEMVSESKKQSMARSKIVVEKKQQNER